jgi:iron complex outermembrane recepter protein
MGNTVLSNDSTAKDEWTMGQGGFRLDWNPSSANRFTLQTNIYTGKPNPDGNEPVIAKGDNIIAKWNHTINKGSDFQLQVYYDHTWRDFNNGFTEDLKTYDIDWQHRNQLAQKHELTYGLNFRLMDHSVTNLQLFSFLPAHKNLHLYSLFFQDEIILIKERLQLTIGSKIEHNSYTGFEYQPSGRITFTLASQHTIWTAVSRAVRTPARIDRDFFLSIAPTLPFITGNDSFMSENMLAYELGWRLQPVKNLSVSLATFYNVYDNIRSAEPGPPPSNIPIKFANGVRGKTYGVELSATQQLTSWWSLRWGYTFIKKVFR